MCVVLVFKFVVMLFIMFVVGWLFGFGDVVLIVVLLF